MALHQYIGARYVPKFYENPNGTSEWLPNVIYEPLTIVTYDSNTYTSKKTVPASIGIPANNPQYWAATGNYNAFMEEIQDEIDDIRDDITELQNPKRYYIFLGDSWNEPVQWSFPVWGELLPQYLGLTSNDYTSLDDDGGGFADSGANDYFIDCIEDNPVTDHEVTDIVVAAGVNDRVHTVSDIKSAIATFVQTCKTMYPKARVYIACVGWTLNETAARAINSTSYVAYKEGAIAAGAIWLEAPYYTLLFASDFADGAHPNQGGQEKVARALYSSLTGGSFSQHEIKTNQLNSYSNFIVGSNTLEVRKNYDTVYITNDVSVPYIEISITDGTNIYAGAWRKFATFNDVMSIGDHVQFVVPAYVTSTNVNGCVPLLIRFETSGDVYLQPVVDMPGTYSIKFTFDVTVPIRN